MLAIRSPSRESLCRNSRFLGVFTLVSDPKILLAAAIRRKKALDRHLALDGVNSESRPTAAQQELLDDLGVIPIRYVRAANQSGKTQTIVRECSWVFQETHPRWKRPAAWGDEKLQMLIVCQTFKQFEDIIWKKLEPLLDPGCYKIRRTSVGIEKITNTVNGNEIVVLSFHNTGDVHIKLQGFVAHWAWIDEMPHEVSVIEEVMRRVASRDGSFVATFTPKVRNDKIRTMVDAATLPYAKLYRFKMFDNPLYASPEKQTEELGKLKGMAAETIATILEGDWSAGTSGVYEFIPSQMMSNPNDYGYTSGWRHILSVDPASASKLGQIAACEDPKTGMWYVTLAAYIEGIYVPEKIILAVEKAVSHVNVVKRVSDPHEHWYIHQAGHMRYNYVGVYNKKERKMELIKNLQAALGTKIMIAPWCTDLINELMGCSWREDDSSKIIAASSYHLLDALQYLVDNLPKYEPIFTASSWADRLIAADAERIKRESRIQVGATRIVGRRRRSSW